MTRPLKYRVPVDFPEQERDVLGLLCDADLRSPAEQLRWLVLNEAKRRGIVIPQPRTTAIAYPEQNLDASRGEWLQPDSQQEREK